MKRHIAIFKVPWMPFFPQPVLFVQSAYRIWVCTGASMRRVPTPDFLVIITCPKAYLSEVNMNVDRLTFWGAVLIAGIVLPNSALAYIGPGAGLSAIGTFLAVVGAVILLIVGFVWYPVKRLLRWLRAKRSADTNEIDPRS